MAHEPLEMRPPESSIEREEKLCFLINLLAAEPLSDLFVKRLVGAVDLVAGAHGCEEFNVEIQALLVLIDVRGGVNQRPPPAHLAFVRQAAELGLAFLVCFGLQVIVGVKAEVMDHEEHAQQGCLAKDGLPVHHAKSTRYNEIQYVKPAANPDVLGVGGTDEKQQPREDITSRIGAMAKWGAKASSPECMINCTFIALRRPACLEARQ